ncbi:glycosyltransferase family 4 protein [soil metagenome]|nr:glycosyltransferase family 4 protein [Gemmatimonadota bacterium]
MHERASAGTREIGLLHVTTIPMTLTFFVGQIGYMKERGLAVRALSSPGDDLGRFGEREGIPTHAVEMLRRISPGRDLAAVARIVRVIRGTRPEIVHAHTPKGGLLGMIAATIARTPVRIYHMRGLPLLGATGNRRRLLRATEQVACRLAHQVYCVSHSVREVAVSEGICPPEKVKVLLGGSGNGVDAGGRYNPANLDPGTRLETRRRLRIPEDAVVLGFVGRIVRDKGIVELATAWRALRERHPQLHLLLVGPFEPQDPVPVEIETMLRGDPRVHLTGMDWETPPFYAAMDVAVLPTYREGFPNVPLEAAAMQLPVVATRIPGCIDAVQDGVTGTLVPPRDAAALEAALESYIEDAELRRRYGRAGRERVLREFRQEAIWEALYQEYRGLLRANGVTAAAPRMQGVTT